jgi:ADP-ribosylation factor protein 1
LRWLEEHDDPDDVFLAQLADFSLQDWTHRTHLRIAWLMLTRHGRREGMRRIFASIKAFIANSNRTRGKSFHETLTYFWCVSEFFSDVI